MTLAFSWNPRRNYLLLASLSALLLGSASTLALAQETHADLSVSAVVTPPYFVPGRRNTVALTVHNDGLDALDIHPPYSITVDGEDHIVTTQPPPYEVVVPADGCAVERFVTEPLPDGNIGLLFVYYFDVLPAGVSRTCTYDIEFYPSTQAPLNLEWQANTWYVLDNIDPDPSNNTFSFTLNAEPPVPSTPIPAGSLTTSLLLGLALLMAARSTQIRIVVKTNFSQNGNSADAYRPVKAEIPKRAPGCRAGTAFSQFTHLLETIQSNAVDTFTHELGHVLGAEHDSNQLSGTPSFPYSYGYGYPALSTGFETIMSQRFYSQPTYYPNRLLQFSNPNVSHKGFRPAPPLTQRQSFLRASRQVELELPIHPPYPLMVPAMSFQAQALEALPKPPTPMARNHRLQRIDHQPIAAQRGSHSRVVTATPQANGTARTRHRKTPLGHQTFRLNAALRWVSDVSRNHILHRLHFQRQVRIHPF